MKPNAWWITLIGTAASIIGVAIAFIPVSPQKDTSRQDMTVGSAGVAGMSNTGNVSINVNPVKPDLPLFKQPKPFPNEIDYRDLANSTLSQKLIGKTVLFRALYLSEWNLEQIYKMAGIPVDSGVFLNHRSAYYGSSMSPLGSSDSEVPPFPISVPFTNLNEVRKLQRGDFILITGTVNISDSKIALTTPDYGRIYIVVSNIKLLHSD